MDGQNRVLQNVTPNHNFAVAGSIAGAIEPWVQDSKNCLGTKNVWERRRIFRYLLFITSEDEGDTQADSQPQGGDLFYDIAPLSPTHRPTASSFGS